MAGTRSVDGNVKRDKVRPSVVHLIISGETSATNLEQQRPNDALSLVHGKWFWQEKTGLSGISVSSGHHHQSQLTASATEGHLVLLTS